MPSEQQHTEKYKHNQKILSNSLFDSNYNDWKITVIFYSAVHIIETFLSKVKVHTSSHKERHKAVRQYRVLREIADEYQTLYMLSIQARYDCVKFNDKTINDALKLLKKIEQVVIC